MADDKSGQTDNVPSGTQRSNGARLQAAKDTASGADDRPSSASSECTSQASDECPADDKPEAADPEDADSARTTAIPIPPSTHAPLAGSGGPGELPMEQPTASLPAPELPPDWESCPTTQIPVVPEPIPARHLQALPPPPPEADAATAQANRKLAWLLAGVVAVAGGLLIGFLRALTPADAPVPLVTPQPTAAQDTSAPAEALPQPLLATPELTGTSTTPPPSPVAAAPVKKVAPKPTLRPARPRVPIAARPTTAKPTTKPTTKPGSGSTSKSGKTYQPSNESPTVDN